jgi:L-ascorbate metabolism protein UlaG (beta-lactamase superfamily)
MIHQEQLPFAEIFLMRRFFLAGLALAAVAIFGASSVHSQGKKDSPTVKITYHGHSFYRIESSKGTAVIFDPHAIEVYGRPIGMKADVALISHFHNDHTQIGVIDDDKVRKNLKILVGLKGTPKNPEWNNIDETFKDIKIRSVGVYHDDQQGLKYGKNAIFIIEVDGWKIAHLGDLGHTLDAEQLKKIGPVDVLMIPVGGIYTINGEQAKRVVDQIKPKEFVFPMHCGNKIYDDLLKATEFLDEFPKANVTTSDDNALQLHQGRKTEQRPRPTVIQLHYWPKGKKE